MGARRLYLAAWVLFFVSGMTGLVYEILWTRRLSLTFGHSLLAVSTVVTAYMGGLALGSWGAGRWADRKLREGCSAPHFLRSYAVLEGFIGLWGLLSLPLLGLVERLYFHWAARGGEGGALHLAVFALSLLTLLPPTTAMGATLPLLSCLFHQAPESLGVKLSRLYASNTWGAVCGAALAGFFWLPMLGLHLSIGLAACLNLLIGALGWQLGKPQLELAPPLPDPPPASGPSGLLPALFALGGFASMLFQLGWTRGVSLFLGSSVYAFSAILVVFLAGIAAGSGLYSWWMRRAQPDTRQLGWLYLWLGLAGALSIPLMSRLPALFLAGYPWVAQSFAALLTLDVFLCALVVGLPTLLSGLLFPMVTHLYHHRSGSLGGSVGTVYGANTLGCILGSFVGGFFVLPELGVQTTLQLGASLCLLPALVLGHRPVRALALVVALGCWNLPGWDTGLASAGLAVSAARTAATAPSSYPPPVFYKDGISCTVALDIEGPSAMSLRLNGKTDASLQLSDRQTQTSLGLIPLIYQSDPRRVAVVGLGSGLTLTALAQSEAVQRIECAELEPAVVECQRFWAPFNQHVVENPRVRLREADGRTFILTSSQPWDVIVSEPSNPWIAGIGNLYTVDFYRACRQRLSPSGCFVQWCNLYALAPQDLELVLRTFFTAFPEGAVWTTGGDLVLVGSSQPLKPDLEPLRRASRSSRWLASELAELGFARPEEFLGQYLCSRAQVLAHIPPGPLNTDDLPRLEYSAPRSLYRPAALLENLSRCLSWRQEDWPDSAELRLDAWLGRLHFVRPDLIRFPMALLPEPSWQAFFATMNQIQPDDPLPGAALRLARAWPARAQRSLARRGLRMGLSQLVLDIYPQPRPDYDVTDLRARALFQRERWLEAAAEFEKLTQLRSDSERWSALAACYFFAGRADAAGQASAECLRLNPYDPQALYIQAELTSRRDPRQALALSERLLSACPVMGNAWTLQVRLLMNSGRLQEARQTVARGLRILPGHPELEALKSRVGVTNR